MQSLSISSITIRRDAEGRYSLNDLHRAAGGEKRHGPSYFLSSPQTMELLAELETTGQPVVTVEGRNGGTWVVKQVVVSYAAWISPKFHLEVINTFLAATQSNVRALPSYVADGCTLIESASRTLRLAPSATLGMYHRLGTKSGHQDILPTYAVDSEDLESSSPTKSLTALLKEHGVPMRARTAYQVLALFGIVEQKTRAGKGGSRKYWCILDAGRKYGKNVTHPENPRQTQPHFYESTFAELITKFGLAESAAA